ncbi:hypothetical protein KR044_002346 [Drosophila immigrans]|nr:hypothetical protein KR044_002346 [Drosophila immigrans]
MLHHVGVYVRPSKLQGQLVTCRNLQPSPHCQMPSKVCWTCRNINLTFYCASRLPGRDSRTHELCIII